MSCRVTGPNAVSTGGATQAAQADKEREGESLHLNGLPEGKVSFSSARLQGNKAGCSACSAALLLPRLGLDHGAGMARKRQRGEAEVDPKVRVSG